MFYFTEYSLHIVIVTEQKNGLDFREKYTLDLLYSVEGFHYYYAISTDNLKT
jgi:hypothetical protein